MKTKTNNTQKNFNIFSLSTIVAGLIFLSNPIVGLVDVFPDFIGYFLLIVGFDKVGRLNGDIEYGVKNLKYLCGVSAVFFVLMFYTFSMDSSWVLTLTFSYMALSIIFGMSACNGIFSGLDYITDRHGKEDFPSAYEPKLMTNVYIIAKAALVVLPQLYAIFEVNALDDLSLESDYMSVLATKKYAVVVCLLLSLGLAVSWLKYVIKYGRSFKKDEKLVSSLTDMYVSEFSKNGVPINFFKISFGSAMILISHIFVYDFVLDTVHFLPEFLSVVVSVLGVLILKMYLDLKGVWKYAVITFAVQIAIFFYRNKFIENVILETWDVTATHLVISSILALLYIVFTYLYFSKIHKVTSDAYEEMFGWKTTEVYEWGDVFYLIALSAGGANIICPIWRPYFVAIMIVSLFAAMYHFTKIYTKFEKND